MTTDESYILSKQADDLEHCVMLLNRYIKVLRGEHEDLTGFGLWKIFVTNLEIAANVRVVSKEAWEQACIAEKGKRP